MKKTILAIERALEERYGGFARVVPSGRLALILGMKALLRPGDRVAMIAPVCEVVAFSAFAAGMRPLFLDSSLDGPRIDPELLSESDHHDVRAVLATNLYGIPEALPSILQTCRDRGWLLIEDCAQVLRSSVGGKAVGTFGDATILSFRKYFDEDCGALICRDASRLPFIDECIRQYTRPCGPGPRVRARLVATLRVMRGEKPDEWLRRRAAGNTDRPKSSLPMGSTRPTIRDAEFSAAASAADSLEGMGDYLTSDHPLFRVFAPPARLERLLAKIQDWDGLAARFRAAAARVRARPGLSQLMIPEDFDPCFLAVPILSRMRDNLIEQIWRRERLWPENIYRPPLPEYLPTGLFDDVRKHPERDKRWSEQLLPIPLVQADAYLRALSEAETGGAEPADGPTVAVAAADNAGGRMLSGEPGSPAGRRLEQVPLEPRKG